MNQAKKIHGGIVAGIGEPILDSGLRIGRMMVFWLMVLSLGSCRQDDRKVALWQPVLVPTSFSYLEDSVSKGLETIDRAAKELAEGNLRESRESLSKGRRTLQELRYYFVPMTRVRQLVFDAGRMFALERKNEGQAQLELAWRIMGEIEEHGGPAVAQAMHESLAMVEDLRFAMEEENRATSTKYRIERSETVAAKFRRLGHKVNMMAIKGDLILAGVHFNEER